MDAVDIREKALNLATASLPLASTDELVKRAKEFESYLAGEVTLPATEPFTGDMEPGLLDVQQPAETHGDGA